MARLPAVIKCGEAISNFYLKPSPLTWRKRFKEKTQRMKDHSAASTSEVDTITRMAHHARAHRTAVHWLLWSPVLPFLSMVLMAVNALRTGNNRGSIYPSLFALPFLLLAVWALIRQGRMHR